MDDLFKVILYIVAVVIYALIKMRKKAPKNEWPQTSAPKQPLPHTTPTRSFADSPPKKAAPPLQQTIKNLDREIEKSKKTIKSEKPITKVYEEKRYETEERKSLEREPLKYESLAKNYQTHFEQYQGYNEIATYESEFAKKESRFDEHPEDEKVLTNVYSEFLRDPENVKKAFVLKEIFDRKHF